MESLCMSTIATFFFLEMYKLIWKPFSQNITWSINPLKEMLLAITMMVSLLKLKRMESK